MTRHHHRVLRLVASTVAATALVAPSASAAGGGESDATLRNDIAHHGRQSAPERRDTTLLNDIAHHGNQQAPPAQQYPAAIIVRVEGGFDWVSAAVGAAGGFGLLLVAGVATSTLRRRHDVDPAQA